MKDYSRCCLIVALSFFSVCSFASEGKSPFAEKATDDEIYLAIKRDDSLLSRRFRKDGMTVVSWLAQNDREQVLKRILDDFNYQPSVSEVGYILTFIDSLLVCERAVLLSQDILDRKKYVVYRQGRMVLLQAMAQRVALARDEKGRKLWGRKCEILLKRGVFYDLHSMVLLDDVKGVAKYLDLHLMDPDIKSFKYAIEYQRTKVLDCFIERGCAHFIFLRDETGVPLLRYSLKYPDQLFKLQESNLGTAALSGYLNYLEYKMPEGPSYISFESPQGVSLLNEAVIKGHALSVKYLVGMTGKLDVNKLFSGKNALHWAVEKGHLEIVKYLVEKARAGIAVRTSEGKSALDLATEFKHKELIGYLLEKGASGNK